MALITSWSFESNGTAGNRCCRCWRPWGFLIHLPYRLALWLSSRLLCWRWWLWRHLAERCRLICLSLNRIHRRHFLCRGCRLDTICFSVTRARPLGRTPIHCRSICLISNGFHALGCHEIVYLRPWLVDTRYNSFLLLIWLCLRWRIWSWFLFLRCWWCLRWYSCTQVVLSNHICLLIAFLICRSSSGRPVPVPAPSVRALLRSASSLRRDRLLWFSWRSSSPLSAKDISALRRL